MRLINTRTMKMHEFVSDPNLTYAILSHTWGEEEVSFQQYSTPEARSMAGYRKIERSCALASRSGYCYLWIDTCCIDKSSSAELSEAINSMYRWYRDAAVCYVHLPDMKPCEDYGFIGCKSFQMLQACRWFTRGWTLQELLAPREVEFFDQDWVLIGTKRNMWSLLSKITGIKPRHLWKSQEASVAQKMSWAANRRTTRTEDLAYSLLGLFNVNMPLLYGEGEKAFKRLQYEILQSTNDESIFAWTDDEAWTSGLLANSPANFAESGDFVPTDEFYRRPYTMTNQGLHIELRNFISGTVEAGRLETPLRCAKESTQGEESLSLHMTYYTDGRGGALRAFRTGPFEVGIIKNTQLHLLRGHQSAFFHIDDFRRRKLQAHWETRLYWNVIQSLTLRLSGELEAEDICINENTGRMKGFSIVNRNTKFLSGQSKQNFPIMYIYWDARECLTFGIPSFDASGSDGDQEPLSAKERVFRDFKLQAGNSLATWLSENKILFIALSSFRPLGKAYIDIQLDSIHNGTEGLSQLTKADPLSAHNDYSRIGLVAAFSGTEQASHEGSGEAIYGQEIAGLVSQQFWSSIKLKSQFSEEIYEGDF